MSFRSLAYSKVMDITPAVSAICLGFGPLRRRECSVYEQMLCGGPMRLHYEQLCLSLFPYGLGVVCDRDKCTSLAGPDVLGLVLQRRCGGWAFDKSSRVLLS